MGIKIPTGIKTPKDKMEFAYNAQEALRLDHNAQSALLAQGQITQEQFNDYINNTFKPKAENISTSIMEARQDLLKSNKYTIDLEDLI